MDSGRMPVLCKFRATARDPLSGKDAPSFGWIMIEVTDSRDILLEFDYRMERELETWKRARGGSIPREWMLVSYLPRCGARVF